MPPFTSVVVKGTGSKSSCIILISTFLLLILLVAGLSAQPVPSRKYKFQEVPYSYVSPSGSVSHSAQVNLLTTPLRSGDVEKQLKTTAALNVLAARLRTYEGFKDLDLSYLRGITLANQDALKHGWTEENVQKSRDDFLTSEQMLEEIEESVAQHPDAPKKAGLGWIPRVPVSGLLAGVWSGVTSAVFSTYELLKTYLGIVFSSSVLSVFAFLPRLVSKAYHASRRTFGKVSDTSVDIVLRARGRALETYLWIKNLPTRIFSKVVRERLMRLYTTKRFWQGFVLGSTKGETLTGSAASVLLVSASALAGSSISGFDVDSATEKAILTEGRTLEYWASIILSALEEICYPHRDDISCKDCPKEYHKKYYHCPEFDPVLSVRVSKCLGNLAWSHDDFAVGYIFASILGKVVTRRGQSLSGGVLRMFAHLVSKVMSEESGVPTAAVKLATVMSLVSPVPSPESSPPSTSTQPVPEYASLDTTACVSTDSIQSKTLLKTEHINSVYSDGCLHIDVDNPTETELRALEMLIRSATLPPQDLKNVPVPEVNHNKDKNKNKTKVSAVPKSNWGDFVIHSDEYDDEIEAQLHLEAELAKAEEEEREQKKLEQWLDKERDLDEMAYHKRRANSAHVKSSKKSSKPVLSEPERKVVKASAKPVANKTASSSMGEYSIPLPKKQPVPEAACGGDSFRLPPDSATVLFGAYYTDLNGAVLPKIVGQGVFIQGSVFTWKHVTEVSDWCILSSIYTKSTKTNEKPFLHLDAIDRSFYYETTVVRPDGGKDSLVQFNVQAIGPFDKPTSLVPSGSSKLSVGSTMVLKSFVKKGEFSLAVGKVAAVKESSDGSKWCSILNNTQGGDSGSPVFLVSDPKSKSILQPTCLHWGFGDDNTNWAYVIDPSKFTSGLQCVSPKSGSIPESSSLKDTGALTEKQKRSLIRKLWKEIHSDGGKSKPVEVALLATPKPADQSPPKE